MSLTKLRTCIKELEDERGPAYADAVSHGRNVQRDLRMARAAAEKKGMTV